MKNRDAASGTNHVMSIDATAIFRIDYVIGFDLILLSNRIPGNMMRTENATISKLSLKVKRDGPSCSSAEAQKKPL